MQNIKQILLKNSRLIISKLENYFSGNLMNACELGTVKLIIYLAKVLL